MNTSRVLQIQAIAFALYGIGFFLIPDIINDAIFGWDETERIFGRVIGGAFLGIAFIEWRVAARDVEVANAWPFALIPGLFVIAFIWERAAGTFTGTDSWYWVNLAVSVVFFLLVGGALMQASPRR